MNRLMTLLLLLFSVAVNAQTETQPEMADALRENGKINVVIGVIVIIFVAIVTFLFILERKLKKLENKLNEKSAD